MDLTQLYQEHCMVLYASRLAGAALALGRADVEKLREFLLTQKKKKSFN
jgi:hypothetical protein